VVPFGQFSIKQAEFDGFGLIFVDERAEIAYNIIVSTGWCAFAASDCAEVSEDDDNVCVWRFTLYN